MKKHIKKKIKNNIFMVGLCLICFLVIPVILMQFEDGGEGWFGMEEFLEFVFWPMAGMGISAFYAISVKNKKGWILVPVCTIICFGVMKIVEDKISFWGILICLIFEVMWYKVISFWRKIEE